MLRPPGAKSWGGFFQCCTPFGRLHWATIVAHSVRWPFTRSGALQAVTWSFSGDYMELFRRLHGAFQAITWSFSGGYMEPFRRSHGAPQAITWCFSGDYMEPFRRSHGAIQAITWCFSGDHIQSFKWSFSGYDCHCWPLTLHIKKRCVPLQMQGIKESDKLFDIMCTHSIRQVLEVAQGFCKAFKIRCVKTPDDH